MGEPSPKKARIDSSEMSFEIKPILPDDLCESIPLEMVLVTTVENKKAISSIILELSRCLPLPTLQHLKRVRQNEIILCKKSDLDSCNDPLSESDVSKAHTYLTSQGIPTEMASSFCEKLSLVGVASLPTKLRWQYDEMNKLWPCKFHPNRYLESLYDGTKFSTTNKEFHCKIASLLARLRDLEEDNTCAICIDPRTNSIVAIATGKITQSPVMHCPMVLVDFVARSQNEGAWRYDDEKFLESTDEKVNLRGIPERFYKIIVETWKEDARFGAEPIRIRDGGLQIPEDAAGGNNLEKYGPYLCTGYDVYLSREPCLMCAMALLHSRVRTIFFLEQAENGALKTLMKLHSVKELNHHYEVFQIVGGKERVSNKCC